MDITVKVARVLSNAEIALSGGADWGIEVGDRVRVMQTIQIHDPDTREVLGEVERTRLTLDVVNVEERFSVAKVRSVSPLLTSAMFSKQSKFITGRDIKDDEYIPLSSGDSVVVTIQDSEKTDGDEESLAG